MCVQITLPKPNMLLEIAQKEQPSKEFKTLCNSLRCPLCGAQLDGNIHPKEAKLYCVRNNKEYRCTWKPDQEFPESESITHSYGTYEYISSHIRISYDLYDISFTKYNLEVTSFYRNATKVVLLEMKNTTRLQFLYQRLEEKQLLDKLKFYLTFI